MSAATFDQRAEAIRKRLEPALNIENGLGLNLFEQYGLSRALATYDEFVIEEVKDLLARRMQIAHERAVAKEQDGKESESCTEAVSRTGTASPAPAEAQRVGAKNAVRKRSAAVLAAKPLVDKDGFF